LPAARRPEIVCSASAERIPSSEEIAAAKDILAAAGARRISPELISCPTCGRCRIDLISLAKEIEERLREYQGYIKVAVMGCAVNGPGEAREAEIGVAGGDGDAVLFVKGKVVRKLAAGKIADGLMDELKRLHPEGFAK
jgi:(E)-4-hydroxy-3-methylbut-2-enyl-diphosphate synthase